MGFTAIILSKEEALALPPDKRPMNFRIPSKIYHSVFEAIGRASMCWKPSPGPNCVFDSTEAEKTAVELCFAIAAELERAGITYESSPKLFEVPFDKEAYERRAAMLEEGTQ